MSIKPSAAAEVRSLIATLAGPDEVKREAAIARLAVIGPRAIDRLLASYSDPASTERTRIAILRVFEAAGDPRPLTVVRDALAGSTDVALAAIGALRGLLTAGDGDTSAAALDALVALVADRTAERTLRLAAVDALRDAPEDVQVELTAALRDDEDAAIRAKVEAPSDQGAAAGVEWDEAIAGEGGKDPLALLEAAASRASTAPLSELQKVIDLAREHEAGAGTSRREQWRALRGELHQALARRGSTVALYDLRETLEGARAVLPESFVAALQSVGDSSCLEPAAAAWTRIEEADWRARLTRAMETIVTREKLGARHAAMKKIAARWPEAYEAISTLSRTTPRRSTRRRT